VASPWQTRWKSLTLDDLEGHWQPVRSAILASAALHVALRSTFIQLTIFRIYEWFDRRTIERTFILFTGLQRRNTLAAFDCKRLLITSSIPGDNAPPTSHRCQLFIGVTGSKSISSIFTNLRLQSKAYASENFNFTNF